MIRVFEELRALGYEGSYDAVRRYAQVWAKTHAGNTAMFGPPLLHHHAFLVSASKARTQDHQGIAVFFRLYGGSVEGVLLAELPDDAARPPAPSFVVVDYVAQKIRQMTVDEYALFAVQHTDCGNQTLVRVWATPILYAVG